MGLLLLNLSVMGFHQFCIARGKVNSMVQIYKHGLRTGVKPGRSVSAGPTFQGTRHIPSLLEFPTSALFSNFLKGFVHIKNIICIFTKRWC